MRTAKDILNAPVDRIRELAHGLIEYVALNHRSFAMTAVVLPLSVILRFVLSFFESKEACGVDAHDRAAKRISDDITSWVKTCGSKKRKICTARAPWQNLSTRFSDYKKDSYCVKVSHLNRMVALDEEKLEVRIEPMVTVGQATRWLLPRGYMLAATLEIEEATVGGLAMAVGMTTHAHVTGMLGETVVCYELIGADGRLLQVTRDGPHADLWACLPWSHGSLGLLVGMTMKVIRVTPNVKLEYQCFGTQKSLCAGIRKASLAEKPAEFVEATLFSPERGVVMKGSFVPDAEIPKKADGSLALTTISRWFQPWFYVHCRDVLAGSKEGATTVEYIETYEYIFRHNRGVFWTLRDQISESVAMHGLYRYALGWLFPPLVTFLKLPVTPHLKSEMVFGRVYQDIVMPLSALEDGLGLSERLFDIWPVLVYPSRVYTNRKGVFPEPRPEDVVPGKNYAMYMDLGVYGTPPILNSTRRQEFKAVDCARECEEFVTERRGAPFLYANTFLSRPEFNKMFNLDLYQKVRDRYGCDVCFPHVYDKTKQSLSMEELYKREKEYLACPK